MAYACGFFAPKVKSKASTCFTRIQRGRKEGEKRKTAICVKFRSFSFYSVSSSGRFGRQPHRLSPPLDDSCVSERAGGVIDGRSGERLKFQKFPALLYSTINR